MTQRRELLMLLGIMIVVGSLALVGSYRMQASTKPEVQASAQTEQLQPRESAFQRAAVAAAQEATDLTQ